MPDIPSFSDLPPEHDTLRVVRAPFAALDNVLYEALCRAQDGKGKERHGSDDVAFVKQPIITITKELGGSQAPLLFQAVKKIYESQRLPPDRGDAELLDAIVYLAAAVLLHRV